MLCLGFTFYMPPGKLWMGEDNQNLRKKIENIVTTNGGMLYTSNQIKSKKKIKFNFVILPKRCEQFPKYLQKFLNQVISLFISIFFLKYIFKHKTQAIKDETTKIVSKKFVLKCHEKQSILSRNNENKKYFWDMKKLVHMRIFFCFFFNCNVQQLLSPKPQGSILETSVAKTQRGEGITKKPNPVLKTNPESENVINKHGKRKMKHKEEQPKKKSKKVTAKQFLQDNDNDKQNENMDICK